MTMLARPHRIVAQAGLVLVTACAAVPAPSAEAQVAVNATTVQAQTIIPIEAWALREAVKNVVVSPDGKNLLMMVTGCKTCDPIIEIRRIDDLQGDPVRLNSETVEMVNARWITDTLVTGVARQQVRKRVRGPEDDSYAYSIFTYNLETNDFKLAGGNFGIVNLLPTDPDHVLIESGTANSSLGQDDPFFAFRPRSYYKLNLKTGRRSLVMRGTASIPTATFDDQGNPRFAAGIDIRTKEVVNYYRNAGDGEWREMSRQNGKDFFENEITYVGAKPGVADAGYVLARNGADTVGLWNFDFANGTFGELIYRNPEADVVAVRGPANPWQEDREPVAVVFPGEKFETHWFDKTEQALVEGIEAQIADAHQVRVTSTSRDGSVMTVRNSGPRDPGSYYLVVDGDLQKIASENPYLTGDVLSDVDYIKYTARDGREIPAYLTKPKQPGPWPLIVLPHGGPYVTEVVGYDRWGQLLAYHGYAVLQPQYRGSRGHGFDHYNSMWNEHGGKMQDDKDDGALHLIEEGLVDPDRVAMFGWSYGGYAALVASQRDPNIYQCVVAGAAVADPKKTYIARKNDFFPYADQLSRQRGAFSGINPIKDVDKVNVPILMVHGSVDRRVLPYHMKDFEKAMRKAGKSDMLDTLWLEGADHFFSTLRYEHQEDFYTRLLSFLQRDCGPGGL
ncbi:prolyl oligopeptidase family serine peptidase [uncultured Algimonas sp.]|uniref:alpha/beta hydrolase family protein n=1 Tax=uncultured Algimonas sp. TaxID=1547920 RepID=UPI00261D14C4|nr:prolyl oligopeptidase family serine peptidase [uncultured Algimonas sp.]